MKRHSNQKHVGGVNPPLTCKCYFTIFVKFKLNLHYSSLFFLNCQFQPITSKDVAIWISAVVYCLCSWKLYCNFFPFIYLLSDYLAFLLLLLYSPLIIHVVVYFCWLCWDSAERKGRDEIGPKHRPMRKRPVGPSGIPSCSRTQRYVSSDTETWRCP